MFDSELRSSRIADCRIGFLNLSGASLLDVVVTSCHIDELDLTEAVLNRVRLEDCRIGTLRLRGARLSDVDLRGLDVAGLNEIDDATALRGATIEPSQLPLLAPALAAGLGLHVV